jgi:hypothetical protein
MRFVKPGMDLDLQWKLFGLLASMLKCLLKFLRLQRPPQLQRLLQSSLLSLLQSRLQWGLQSSLGSIKLLSAVRPLVFSSDYYTVSSV